MVDYEITNTMTPEEYMDMISLSSAKGKESFYNKFGFQNTPNDAVGCGMYQWIEKA
ncbi:MAG: hypothetical protein K6G47_10540 [Clostridia bacterium]|nr:hypothetical protein [Clostridia bacterium]